VLLSSCTHSVPQCLARLLLPGHGMVWPSNGSAVQLSMLMKAAAAVASAAAPSGACSRHSKHRNANLNTARTLGAGIC
jgi:hypothetical protein